MTNRRNFLKNSALLTAGGLAGSGMINTWGSVASAAKSDKQIGLQTYSVGQELGTDVPAGLRKISNMGYTELELAGYNDGMVSDYTLVEYNKMAEDAGLKITGSHLNPPVRGAYSRQNMGEISEFWKKAVEEHAKINIRTMVQPRMPSVTSEDEAKLIGEVFNNAGQIAKDAGILWGYHNHDDEFGRIMTEEDISAAAQIEEQRSAFMAQMAQGGSPPQIPAGGMGFMRGGGEPGTYIEKLFLDNTDPDLVMFELDVYWAVMGGQDPVQWLRDYPNRYKLLHVKDRWIVGNSGMLNWENIFKTAYEIGIIGYYVELEGGSGDQTQFHGIEESVKFLLKAPYVK